MATFWNAAKGVTNMLFRFGSPSSNESAADIEIGTIVVFFDKEFDEERIGEVRKKWATVLNELIVNIVFEDAVRSIFDELSEYNDLQRFTKTGRFWNIPVLTLQTHQCFNVLRDEENRTHSEQQSSQKPSSQMPQSNSRRIRGSRALDSALDSCNNNTKESVEVAVEAHPYPTAGPSTSAPPAEQGPHILSLLNPFRRTPEINWNLDSGPEFIVPAISLKDFLQSTDYKGIQGRNNSCYLDSTLSALFSFTEIFDKVIFEQPQLDSKNDAENNLHESYPLGRQVRNLLAKHIVNTFRQANYCPAEPVLHLRKLLSPLNSKIASHFMDPEEFLLLLLDEVLHLKEFIRYDNGISDFLHQVQLYPEVRGGRQVRFKPFITTQRLLDSSMNSVGMKFSEVPIPALILEMPRSNGKLLNGLKGIIPNLSLDITSLTENALRSCSLCALEAALECPECLDSFNDPGSTAFCSTCHELSHKHPDRRHHSAPTPISKEIKMDLIAVICIRASHFVSFVRTDQNSPDAPWVFFDSNPTEKYPIHEILPEMGKWISEVGMARQDLLLRFWPHKPEMLRRIVEDGHICIYSQRSRKD